MFLINVLVEETVLKNMFSTLWSVLRFGVYLLQNRNCTVVHLQRESHSNTQLPTVLTQSLRCTTSLFNDRQVAYRSTPADRSEDTAFPNKDQGQKRSQACIYFYGKNIHHFNCCANLLWPWTRKDFHVPERTLQWHARHPSDLTPALCSSWTLEPSSSITVVVGRNQDNSNSNK